MIPGLCRTKRELLMSGSGFGCAKTKSDLVVVAFFRLEFAARSMCDGIAVWGREMARPQTRAFADDSCP
jgi:hypothetical protein